MPILTLGFALGVALSRGIPLLFQQRLGAAPDAPAAGGAPGTRAELVSDDAAGLSAAVSCAGAGHFFSKDQDSSYDPYFSTLESVDSDDERCEDVCRFDNFYNNCWMNATLQATLALRAVKEKLGDRGAEDVAQLSETPKFSELFLAALRSPGRSFSLEELNVVLLALSEDVPSLVHDRENDPLDLLTPHLSWLEKCGVRTTVDTETLSNCRRCGVTLARASLGSVVYLHLPKRRDTIESLLRCLNGTIRRARCPRCRSRSRTRQYWSRPEVLTFYLNRIRNDGSVLRGRVFAPEEIQVQTSPDESQRYKLSSVICHLGCNDGGGHYWAYMLEDHLTFKANDLQISVKEGDRPNEVHTNGVVFFYEISLAALGSPLPGVQS